MIGRLLAAALVLTLVAPAPARALSGAPVEIEALIDLTGPGAFFGASAAKTLKIIEDRTNATGGIDGRPLKFVIEDEASSPQTALQIVQQLIARNVPAILGPSLTVTCQAVYPIVADKGPVSYCISPSVVTAPGSYMFANSSSSVDGMSTVVRFFRERGMTRLAVLNATDASGQSVDKTLATVFALPENKDVTVVAHEHFAPNDISVSAQMSRIKAADPQGLISWAVGTPFATVLRGANDAGFDEPILTGAGNMTFAQVKQYAPYMPKQLYFEGFLAMATGPDVPPRVRKAQAAFHRAFADAGVVPDGGYVGIYDMATLYVEAYKHFNGTPTAEQLHDYIEGLRDYVGANGIYDFHTYPQRGLGQTSNVVETYDASKNAFVAVSKPGGYR